MDALLVEEKLNVFLNVPQILYISALPILQGIMATHHDQRWGKQMSGAIMSKLGIRPHYIAGGMVPVGAHWKKRLPMPVGVVDIDHGSPLKPELGGRPLLPAEEWMQKHMTHYSHSTLQRYILLRRDPASHMMSQVPACAVTHQKTAR